MAFVTSYLLHKIWAFDESHVYVSTEADDGTVMGYDGSTWSVLVRMPSARKFGLWGMGPLNIWAVGGCWNICHYDGTVVDQTNCLEDAIGMGIWGSSLANIWTIGAFWDFNRSGSRSE